MAATTRSTWSPMAWRETDYETTDLEKVIQDLLTSRVPRSHRVVVFNTAERWSEDVSEEIAQELRRRQGRYRPVRNPRKCHRRDAPAGALG